VLYAPVLARGVELVDTPGTGSVYAHNTAAAEAALETMDAAVLALTADPPVSASERELMARVAELSVTMFVVLNKADYLSGYDAGGKLAAFETAGGGCGSPDRAGSGGGGHAEVNGSSELAPIFAAWVEPLSSWLARGVFRVPGLPCRNSWPAV
jgi:hypothetical protein